MVRRVLFCLAGLALLAALVGWSGTDGIGAALAAGGPWLALVAVFHLLPIAATAVSWGVLLRAREVRPFWLKLMWWRWLGDSVNALLPVAQVGGEVLRGRLLVAWGVPGALVAAGVIVDLTLALVTLVVFILAGLGLLAVSGHDAPLASLAGGVAVFALLLFLFYRLQRSGGLLRLARVLEDSEGGSRLWESVAGGAGALERELAALYARPVPLLHAAGWRLAAWVLGALEMGLALALLGHPLSLGEMLILESVTQAFRNAGFFIPAALGVQEGGFLVAGAALGLPPDLALALSLVKRGRDIVLGLPALAGGLAAGMRSRGVAAGGPLVP